MAAKTRSRALTLVVALFVGFFLLRTGAGLYVDWLWFQEVGLEGVFSRTVRAQSLVGLTAGVLGGLLIWLQGWLALRGASPILFEWVGPNGQPIRIEFPKQKARTLTKVAAVLAGLFLLSRSASYWDVLYRALYAQSFGKSDPILGRDAGFYVFKLPALQLVVESLWVVLVLSVLLVGVLYLFQGELMRLRGRLKPGPRARRHLLFLLAGAALLSAASAQLRVFGLLVSPGALFTGIGYTDLYAWLPLLRVWTIAGLAAAVVLVIQAFRPLPYATIGLIGMYLLLVGASWIYPGMLQRLVVVANEPEREAPFIAHNIAATREAFNLETVEERELTGDHKLTAEDIERNAATVKNIRLWDHAPLLDTFGQIQEIRTYYEFESVDNDRYEINGELQQIMLSPRELSIESLPNQSWANVHLAFTHGFGLTLGPVNRVTAEGLPVLLIRDIPPRSDVPSLKIDRPQIYFGELTEHYVIVRTRQDEFDYPSGDANAVTRYSGSGGVSLGSFGRRLLFAFVFGAPNILLSTDMTSESRILFHRDIRERAGLALPFLKLDRDPYMVISRGKLFWIQDAYTVSDAYPYSQQSGQPGGGLNYIRNSVKIVTDAYDGSLRFYVADPSDPILRTYQAIFPGVFEPIDGMDPDLRRHVRYPEDMFALQARVYSTYHMKQADIFYKKEDQWEIPEVSGTTARMEPYYTIMKLPQGSGEEFILMLPLTPRLKDNLGAWMIARSDGEHYGKLVAYRFPRQKLVYGPSQIIARINQEPEISRQISLWDQRGSDVVLGTLLVIPIEEALIYVRPLYLRAERGKIPELKRVIVAYENQIAMEETLERALARVFGARAETTARPTTTAQPSDTAAAPAQDLSQQQLIEQAAQHYEQALRAQREGNWAVYGQEIGKLGETLRKLKK